jgi:hypothetical protein
MIELTKTHIAVLLELINNERQLNHPTGRTDLCRGIFATDNVPGLDDLVKSGLVIKEKNLAYNQRKKYHIPNSTPMSRYAYGLTQEGRDAFWMVYNKQESQS